jgi:hypothetical protein
VKHSVSNGKRHVSNVNKRAKMFAVCAWTQIAVRRDFFIHWFTDLPTVNIQKVKNKKNFERQQFYDFS